MTTPHGKGSARGASSKVCERKKHDFEREAGRRLMGQVAEDAERQASALLTGTGITLVELLRVLATGFLDRTWHDLKVHVMRRRQLENMQELDKLPTRMPTSAELIGLMAEIVAGQRVMPFFVPDKEDREFWVFFGTSRKGALAAVKKERASRRAPTRKMPSCKKS